MSPLRAPMRSANANRRREEASARRSGAGRGGPHRRPCRRSPGESPRRPAEPSPAARLDDEVGAVAQGDEHRPGVDERAPALDQQLEDALELRLASDRASDRGRRLERRDRALELVAPGGDTAVQPRVVDRDRGPVRQDDERLLVGLVEPALVLLGQVQVAVGLAADEDRHAEERPHGRMTERKAV